MTRRELIKKSGLVAGVVALPAGLIAAKRYAGKGDVVRVEIPEPELSFRQKRIGASIQPNFIDIIQGSYVKLTADIAPHTVLIQAGFMGQKSPQGFTEDGSARVYVVRHWLPEVKPIDFVDYQVGDRVYLTRDPRETYTIIDKSPQPSAMYRISEWPWIYKLRPTSGAGRDTATSLWLTASFTKVA